MTMYIDVVKLHRTIYNTNIFIEKVKYYFTLMMKYASTCKIKQAEAYSSELYIFL
jgi:hypothetical protein